MEKTAHQQHPISTYLSIWLLLFVLSTFSYLVDFFHVEGTMRWFLILLFMFLKAGLIISVFMHMKWERLAMRSAILLPPLALLVFVALMVIESNYVSGSRATAFTPVSFVAHE
ncbi:cytochrome C oxidase subunit IV [Rhodobacterales bacterium 52_120_T64]|nr:cytochrome C oxidase subunit IV [Rhodobacterales bacterium 52_120_T64]